LNFEYCMLIFYVSLLILTVALSSVMATYAWRRRPSPGARPFSLVMLSLLIWSFAYIFEILGSTIETKFFFLKIEYIGVVGLPTFWFILVIEYSGFGKWLTRRTLSLLAVEPLIVLALLWTSPYHNLYYSSIGLVSFGDFQVLALEYQPTFWIHAFYSYALLLTGGVMLTYTYLKRYESNKRQLIILLSGLLIPWFGNALYLFRLGPSPQLDLTPVFFAISSPILALGIFRFQLMDLLPVAYDTLVESMHNGLLVLDDMNRIVYLNPELERIIGCTATEVRGRQAFQHLPPFFPLPEPNNYGPYGEISILSTQGRQYYELQSSPLLGRFGRETGRLIVVRNITHHKNAEKALLKRAEELSKLNATHLDIATIQDITYLIQTIVKRAIDLLNADGGALFLMEEGQETLQCKFQYRHQYATSENLSHFGIEAACLADKNGKPLLLSDYKEWIAHEKPASSDNEISSLVSAPLIWRNINLGVLNVFSVSDKRNFSQDDLEMVTLFSNQAAIALENARLFDEEQRRAREAETLRLSASAVAATLDQDKAIECILEQLGHVVPYDSASVQLLINGYLEIVGGKGLPNLEHIVGFRFPIPGRNPNTLVIESAKTLILEDIDSYKGFTKIPDRRIRSWLGVPIIFHEEVIGMLSLDSYQERFYRHEHARIAVSFADQVAVAIQNARLYAQVESRVDELGRLYKAAQDMAASLEPEIILKELARHLTEALGATSGRVLDIDQENGVTTLLASHISETAADKERATEPGQKHLLSDFPTIYKAFEDGSSLSFHADDPDLFHSERQYYSTHGVKSIVLVPIVARGRLIGKASIWESRRRRTFTTTEKRLAQALAQHGAGVMENARLYSDIRKRMDELDALRATLTDLSSELELPRLLNAIIQRAASLLGATGGDLGIYDPGIGKLRIVVSYNMGHDYTGVLMELGEGVMGYVSETLEPLIISHYQEWEGRSLQYQEGPWHAVIAAPMLIGGKLVGAIGMVDSDQNRVFTTSDQHLLTLFAQQAAIAIDNARLFFEVQQLAITDPLTGLYNRRHLFQLGLKEFNRAKRFNRPLSAVMLDFDNFKYVNDTHGHSLGDQVLVSLAHLLKKNIREIDILARYGGDEFAIILPETDEASAISTVDRLRALIQKTPIPIPSGFVTLSISAGIGVITPETNNFDTLLLCADNALFEVKHSGRNRVEAR
jgi:diguanylate cyclase (GGDEF)-like protein/PAS domain S-box-containing protein